MKLKKKVCTFCGEPMEAADKECKQCGWDSSKVSAPESDPADVRARIFVGIGLAAAYFAMFSLINGADLPAQSEPVARVAVNEPVGVSVAEPAIAIGAATAPDSAATARPRSSVVNVKVADVKNATILPRDAINYPLQVAEGDHDCHLTGQLKSIGGDVEVFLLRDDDFIFWRANPAAIPHTNWEPIRASDSPLDYRIDEAGNYYLIVSNALSGTAHKTVAIKASLKCVGAAKA